MLRGDFENFNHFKLNGTTQPLLALKNLKETEKLKKAEHKKVEKVIARALGLLDLGGCLGLRGRWETSRECS
jgi:hypothetical protein